MPFGPLASRVICHEVSSPFTFLRRVICHEVSSPSRLFVFGDWIFFMVTILQLKVTKRRLLENVSLERWNWLYHCFQKEYEILSWITSISYKISSRNVNKGTEFTNVPEPIYPWMECHPRDKFNCTVDVYENPLSISWPCITCAVNLLFLSFNRKTIAYVSRSWVTATIVCQVYQIHDLIMLTVVLRWV